MNWKEFSRGFRFDPIDKGAPEALVVLRHDWNCAGVLTFGAKLMRPLPRDLRIDRKVRLIDCVTDREIGQTRLRDSVTSLTTRGIDARGVLLVGSVLSDETIRHGGAY